MATFMKAVTYCDGLSLILKRCKYVALNRSMFMTKHCSTSTQSYENYDITISGGGMVGTTLACAIG